jgi:hypothetical protein
MESTVTNFITPQPGARVDDWSLSAFLDSPRARYPEFLVNPLTPECSLTMLSAEPGSGKTVIAMALGLAVASGQPFLGLPTKQAPVLFIGEDAPVWDYAKVLSKLLAGSLRPTAFHILCNEGYRLLNSGWRARLGEYVEKHGIKLVIIDTLRATHDRNENDSGEMQQVMNELRALCVTYGVSVVFLHHTSKKNAEGVASEYRGSSVLLGSCDNFIHMSATVTDERSKLLTLKTVKGRGTDGTATRRATFSLDDQSAHLGAVAASLPKPLVTLESAVLARLQKGPALMSDLLAVVPANGRRPKTIRGKIDAYLEELESVGRVRNALEGGKYRWELVSEDQKKAA